MKTPAKIAWTLILITFNYCNASSQALSGVVNAYYHVTAVNSPVNTVTVDNASGLAPGQRVLIIQMKGAAINATNTADYGDITAINDAGNYEINTICNISGNDVQLKNKLLNTYNASGAVQLVTIPSGPSIVVAGMVTGLPWDPVAGKGGIVALEATGTISLNADINVSGQGFQGGALVNYPSPTYSCDWYVTVDSFYMSIVGTGDYNGGKKGEGITSYIFNEECGRGKLANGGGGGNNAETGGAGGGNYGAGGVGGQRAGESFLQCHGAYAGIGGSSLATYGYSTGTNRVFPGGGGGSGWENDGVSTPGGNGGGIIILSAGVIAGGGGRLFASGVSGVNPACLDPYQAEGDGGGGGGAGGTIILNAATITGAITAEAKGARGSDASNRVNDCTGPGGGGGGGVIWAQGAVFPAAVSAAVNGGANGVVSAGNSKLACRGSSNGATSGIAGLSQSGYALPASTAPVCVVLASPVLQYFTARHSDQGIILTWALSSPGAITGIHSFILQRSAGLSPFNMLATLPYSKDSMNYHYAVPSESIVGAVAYRLAWQDMDGNWYYSSVLTVEGGLGPDLASVRLQPNPAADHLDFIMLSPATESGVITIFNTLGKALRTLQVSRGMSTIRIPLGGLPPGIYFLALESGGKHQVRSFLKK